MTALTRFVVLAQVPLALVRGLAFHSERSPEPGTVDVKFLGEAGCPFTRAFIRDALNKTLSTPGLQDALRFDFLPFGNAYFSSAACSNTDSQGRQVYNANTRMCFNMKCGPNSLQRREDCFTGELVCQHGFPECPVNRYFACARKMARVPGQERLKQSFMGYMPFVHCVAARYQLYVREDIHSIVKSCAAESGLDDVKLGECHTGPEGDEAIRDVASQTPTHVGVPWIYVNGEPMEADHEGEIFQKVCEALQATGGAPQECHGASDSSHGQQLLMGERQYGGHLVEHHLS